MKRSNILKAMLLTMLIAFTLPSISNASTHPKTLTDPQTERIHQLESRLNEIKAMDTRQMTRAERRELRAEVKTIKKEMDGISGGVYLSVGALILIALLLILLL
jgi:hypothetical protein